MRVLFFGTYEGHRQPRIGVLQEGLAALGVEVAECVRPLGLDTSFRVGLLRKPWLAPRLAWRVLGAWWRLWRRARRLPRPDAVVVGYMGHFDVHLARRAFRRTPVALDHMISFRDTALDRGAANPRLLRLLEAVDRAAVGAADVPFVDTPEHLGLLPAAARERALVVPLGAPTRWFAARAEPEPEGPLRVVFYGLYTPLQGAPVIGEAIGLLAGDPEVAFTMVGSGQDLAATRRAAAGNPRVRWIDWIDGAELPRVVASHDVCLGIFGTGAKAGRVVPHKVVEGAAAGCAILTADTPPQRRALGDAAVYAPPGDAKSLAEELRALAGDRERLGALRAAARRRAEEAFRPEAVAAPLRDALVAAAARAR